MQRFLNRSLERQIIVGAGVMVSLIFLLTMAYIAANDRRQLEQSAYQDIQSRNRGYVNTIHSIFQDKTELILALRDDLELYDTRGQMWIHLAAHSDASIFDDPKRSRIYAESFQKKLGAYRAGDQLSAERLTPQLQRMLANVTARRTRFGEGMKFFYVGAPSEAQDPEVAAFDHYQDSSLWVPDARVDAPYHALTRPWYLAGQEAGANRVVFTEPYAERRTGEAITAGSTSIRVERVKGTFAAAISMRPILDKLVENAHERSDLMIFSRGTHTATEFVATPPKYIYSSRDPMLGEKFVAYNDAKLVESPQHRDVMALYDATRQHESGALPWVIDGRDMMVAYQTVPLVGWRVYTSVSRDEAMQPVVALQRRILVIALLGLLLLLGVLSVIVRRALKPLEHMAGELKQLADTGDLSRRVPVSGANEIGQMGRAINEMLDNVAAPVRQLADKTRKIAYDQSFEHIDVPAKGDIARLVASFNDMSLRLVDLEQALKDASPLTGLPGGVTIEAVVQRRIDAGTPFAFCAFDIDDFKPFNDKYGYSRGNLVIKDTAYVIQDALAAHGGADDFLGHVGGDDFIVVCGADRAQAICRDVIERFDAGILDFYDEADRKAGGIIGTSRQGLAMRFPVMSLSVCLIDSRGHRMASYITAGEIAAELKRLAKTMPGSNLVVDQRGEASAGV